MPSSLHVLVLAGGPDRERPVSLHSGHEVAAALLAAGHKITQRDIGPADLAALDEFVRTGCDVIFPVLHGGWGEGGGLQRILDLRQLPYVGSGGPAAELCMDKHRTKMVFQRHGLPTPSFELLNIDQPTSLDLPVVVKPTDEGSSIALSICRTQEQLHSARQRIRMAYHKVLVEQYITGRELTVGVLSRGRHDPSGDRALPAIEIIPATEYYDYEAKYERDDTRYNFDIELPRPVLDKVSAMALTAHRVLGVRHLSRVDFIVDLDDQPWLLEINTMPGFTRHSLLPMAAAKAGIDMPALVDRLVRAALEV